MKLLYHVGRQGDEIIRQLQLDVQLKVMQEKSPVTYRHSEQVAAALVEQFIEHDFIEVDFLVQAYVAAFLHDIGKLRPDLLELVNSDEPFRLDAASQVRSMLTEAHSLHGHVIIRETLRSLSPDDFKATVARTAAITTYAHHLELSNILKNFPEIDDTVLLCVLGTRAIDMVQASTDLQRGYVRMQVWGGRHAFMMLEPGGEVSIDREMMRRSVVRSLGPRALLRFPVLESIIERVDFPKGRLGEIHES